MSAGRPVGDNMADKTFINRWSRTKLAGDDKTDEPDLVAEAPDQSATLPVNPENNNETPEAQLPPDLPTIESLDKDSDYTPFLAENVPEELAQKAFRKLWTSDPAFAVLDGLNDYDDDYSALGMVEMVVETAYKVGKGIVTEDEDKAEAEAEAEAEDEDEAEIEEQTAAAEPVADEPPLVEDSGDSQDEHPPELAQNSELPVPHGGKH